MIIKAASEEREIIISKEVINNIKLEERAEFVKKNYDLRLNRQVDSSKIIVVIKYNQTHLLPTAITATLISEVRKDVYATLQKPFYIDNQRNTLVISYSYLNENSHYYGTTQNLLGDYLYFDVDFNIEADFKMTVQAFEID